MKKTFKFFMCAAIVAAGFVGCSSEEVTPGGPVGPEGPGESVVEGKPTYATFNFKIEDATTTKANSGMTSSSEDVNDGRSTIHDVRLLIFNKDGNCQLNGYYEAADLKESAAGNKYKTVPLTSGQKNIFVLVNTGVSTALKAKLDAIVALDASNSSIIPTTYSAFYNSLTGEGINQYLLITNPAQDPGSFSINDLVSASTSNGTIVMTSSIDNAFRNLVPSIEEGASSGTAPGGALPEDDATNHFVFPIKRVVAKGIVYNAKAQVSNATPTKDGLGSLTEIKYNIDNVNKSVNLIQASNTPYAQDIMDLALLGNQDPAPYATYFYKEYNFVNMANASTLPNATTNPRYFFTENKNSAKGGRTFTAIQAKYKPDPNQYYSAIKYDVNLKYFSGSKNDLAFSGTTFYKLAPGDHIPSTIRLTGDELFATVDLAKYVAYCIEHFADPSFTAEPSSSDLNTAYGTNGENLPAWMEKYDGGICWYRLDLGIPTGGSSSNTSYVERNKFYQAKITEFQKLGYSKYEDLNKNPDDGAELPTYITAIITITDWTAVSTEHEISVD